jgi:hypothetical protein
VTPSACAQDCLPDIFESAHRCFSSINGRMTAGQMRDKVLGVLRMWERVSLFPPLFLNGLEATFLRRRYAVASRCRPLSRLTASRAWYRHMPLLPCRRASLARVVGLASCAALMSWHRWLPWRTASTTSLCASVGSRACRAEVCAVAIRATLALFRIALSLVS